MCPKKILFAIPLSLVLYVLLPMSAVGSKDDVRRGMSVEDATRVTKDCIQAASGIEPRQIRPEDKLDFLGITDDLRLEALRRYLIRNTEIGVQSIWGVSADEIFARQFIIGKTALLKMDKTWTVEKVATTVRESSGIPRLSYSRAALVVTSCKKMLDGPFKDLAVDRAVEVKSVPAFVDCIVAHPQYGVPSATISAPTGETFEYQFSDRAAYIGIMKACLEPKGGNDPVTKRWTYEGLIRFVSDYAEVIFSPEMTASHLVVNAILKVRVGPVRNTAMTTPYSFSLSTVLVAPAPRRRITEDVTLRELGVDPVRLVDELVQILSPSSLDIEACTRTSIQKVLSAKRDQASLAGAVSFTASDLRGISSDSTVREVIDLVAEVIKRRSPEEKR